MNWGRAGGVLLVIAGVYQLTPTLDELTLKDKFQKTWTVFARSGRPGTFWNRYGPARDNYAIFNTPTSSGTLLRTKQCDYWESLQ